MKKSEIFFSALNWSPTGRHRRPVGDQLRKSLPATPTGHHDFGKQYCFACYDCNERSYCARCRAGRRIAPCRSNRISAPDAVRMLLGAVGCQNNDRKNWDRKKNYTFSKCHRILRGFPKCDGLTPPESLFALLCTRSLSVQYFFSRFWPT